jgi:CRP-like cAMP-binding protein
MKHESVLARAGEALSRVWFPHSGIISLVVNLSEGEMVEVAMIGRDSVFGAAAIHDGGHSPNDAIVQAPGVASVIDLAHFCYAVAQSPPLRDALARHDQILLLRSNRPRATPFTRSSAGCRGGF